MTKSSIELLAAAKETEQIARTAAAAATQKVIDQQAGKAATELEEKIKSLVAVVELFPESTKFPKGAKAAAEELAAAMGVTLTAGKVSKPTEAKTRTRVSQADKDGALKSFLDTKKENEKFLLKELTAHVKSELGDFSGSIEVFLGLKKKNEVKKTKEKNGLAFFWKKC